MYYWLPQESVHRPDKSRSGSEHRSEMHQRKKRTGGGREGLGGVENIIGDRDQANKVRKGKGGREIVAEHLGALGCI